MGGVRYVLMAWVNKTDKRASLQGVYHLEEGDQRATEGGRRDIRLGGNAG